MGWLDKDWRLTKVALETERIPLKCIRCGAQFVTLNRGPLGAHPIYFGNTSEKQSANRICQGLHHNLQNMQFDLKAYKGGDF